MKTRTRIAALVVPLLLIVGGVSFATYHYDWADEYIIGLTTVELDTLPAEVAIHAQYRDSATPAPSWSLLGYQTKAGRCNAVQQAGSFREERSASRCGTVRTSMSRGRSTVSGFRFARGSACPYEDTPTYIDPYDHAVVVKEHTTCSWPNSDTMTSSRTMEADHCNGSNGSTGWMDSESGVATWAYQAKLSSTFIDPGDAGNNQDTGDWSCYYITWSL